MNSPLGAPHLYKYDKLYFLYSLLLWEQSRLFNPLRQRTIFRVFVPQEELPTSISYIDSAASRCFLVQRANGT